MNLRDLNIYVYETVIVTDGLIEPLVTIITEYLFPKHDLILSLLEQNSGFFITTNSPPKNVLFPLLPFPLNKFGGHI